MDGLQSNVGFVALFGAEFVIHWFIVRIKKNTNTKLTMLPIV